MLLPHLGEGEDTVGMRVEFDHLAATLTGHEVTIATHVAEVEGRRVVSKCTIRDKVGVLGQGSHSRYIVDMGRTAAKLEERRAMLDAAG